MNRHSRQAGALRHAVRFRVVFKYFGQLCLVIGALTLVPLGVSLLFGDLQIALRYALVIVGMAGLGAVLARLRAPSRVQKNEGMVVVALIFLFTPLVMSYPMMASGLSFEDALFEAVSGGTTTGLSTLASIEQTPSTFLFARAWMQWYGGLGIIVFSLALLMTPGMAAKRLAASEELTLDDVVGGTRAYARRMFKIYCIFTGVGILGLWLLDAGFFNGILYTFAAVSTGGFAPQGDSLAGLSRLPAQAWVTLLCVICAIPLPFFYRVYRKKWRFSVNFLQLRALLISAVLVTLMLGLFMWWAQGSLSHSLYHAPFVAFAAQTTAGFSTMDLATLDPASKLTLVVSMAIGGGAGSTAGGLKLLRLLIVIRVLQNLIMRVNLSSRAVLQPRLEDRRLADDEMREAMLLILLFVGVIVFSWLPFVALGYDPLDSLFEVTSATGTVGLSVGLTNAELPTLLKGVLCADMLLGRLEIIAWLVFLRPSTWIGRKLEV